MEFLSKFNFAVTYQGGKKNDKANALTKKPNKCPANEKNNRQKHKMQILLPLKRIDLQLIKKSEPTAELQPEHKEVESHAKPQAKSQVKAEY